MTTPSVSDSSDTRHADLPLCVDLDGTLIRCDSLHEAVTALIRAHPIRLFGLGAALLKGKAAFKRSVATAMATDPEDLPYTQDLLEYLRAQRSSGRKLILVTAADESVARSVADHLGIFDEVIASDGTNNLRGKRKAKVLVERFGQKQFDYAGNDYSDLAVWAEARNAIVVNASPSLRRSAEKTATVERSLGQPHNHWKSWIRVLRPHQWVKNLLVFVPVFAGHAYRDTSAVLFSVLFFVAFCATASGVYILNDLMDISADRRHPTKRRRPFAAGDISLMKGLILGLFCLALGCTLGFLCSRNAGAIIVGYIAANALYSGRLKRIPLLDVFVLAGFYVVRILGGAVAAKIAVSEWLIAFAGFFFLGLAFLKRATELERMSHKHPEGGSASGRGYHPDDRNMIERFGISSGFLAALVMSLYIQSPMAMSTYKSPDVLWLAIPIMLYWTCRMWLLTSRGQMHDDPIVFAVKDPTSWMNLLLLGAVAIGARYLT